MRRGKTLIDSSFRYHRQLEEYKQKGYFTADDGTKSNIFVDPKKKVKAPAETPVKGKRKSAAAIAVGKV